MIKGVNHVGITVESLDRSVRFYRDVLGMQLIVDGASFSGDLYEQILSIKGVRGRISVLRIENLELELFEFSNGPTRLKEKSYPVSDQGITHFCIEIKGIHKMYDHMKSLGVTFHCPPLDFSEGVRATYARDPDGNIIELLELDAVS